MRGNQRVVNCHLTTLLRQLTTLSQNRTTVATAVVLTKFNTCNILFIGKQQVVVGSQKPIVQIFIVSSLFV